MNLNDLSGTLPDIIDAWTNFQQQAEIKPIRDAQDYQAMRQMAQTLRAHLVDAPLCPATDLLEMIVALMTSWEARRAIVAKPEPHRVLRYLLWAHGLRQKDLADIVSPSVVSDIVSGRRSISRNAARRLAARSQVDVGVFL